MPIAFDDLKADLELRPASPASPTSTCCYPKWSTETPDGPVRRYTAALQDVAERAGLPATIKMHELRHSAADNLWRETGNLLLAQQLLRHDSVATTQAYLHPSRDDLAQALTSLQVVKSEPDA